MSLISVSRAGVSTASSRASSSDWVIWVISIFTNLQTSRPFSMGTLLKMSHAASMRLTFKNPQRWYDRTSGSSLSMAREFWV